MIWLALLLIAAGLPCDAACAARAAERWPIWPLFLMWPLLMLAIAPWLPFVLWNMVRAWLAPEPLPTITIPYRVAQGVPVEPPGFPWNGVLWIDEHGPDGVKRIWEQGAAPSNEANA